MKKAIEEQQKKAKSGSECYILEGLLVSTKVIDFPLEYKIANQYIYRGKKTETNFLSLKRRVEKTSSFVDSLSVRDFYDNKELRLENATSDSFGDVRTKIMVFQDRDNANLIERVFEGVVKILRSFSIQLNYK